MKDRIVEGLSRQVRHPLGLTARLDVELGVAQGAVALDLHSLPRRAGQGAQGSWARQLINDILGTKYEVFTPMPWQGEGGSPPSSPTCMVVLVFSLKPPLLA